MLDAILPMKTAAREIHEGNVVKALETIKTRQK
jgi:hypothetical protein